MSKFKSIDITPTTDNIKKYYCSWNGGEIIQIHTKETLYQDYKGTNLFDDDSLFETIGNGFDNLTIKDYLNHSNKDDDFLNVNYHCDNMEIQRIV